MTAGIQAAQGSTTVNAAGASSFAAPQTGLVVGTLVTFSLVGATHSSLLWSLGVATGSGTTLSSTTATEPTCTPDIGSDKWVVRLDGYDSGGSLEASYFLPLDIAKVTLSTFTGPLALPYVHAATVDTPGIGQTLFQDWDNAGALSAKDSSAVVRQLGVVRSGTTGARPSTTYLARGTMYFDTTLAAGAGKPIYWNGSIWVLSDGTPA